MAVSEAAKVSIHEVVDCGTNPVHCDANYQLAELSISILNSYLYLNSSFKFHFVFLKNTIKYRKVLLFYFLFVYFFGLSPRHEEVPGPGTEPVPQK